MKQHSRDQIFLIRERNDCRSSNARYFAPYYFIVLTLVIWVTIISCWRKTVYIAWINIFYILNTTSYIWWNWTQESCIYIYIYIMKVHLHFVIISIFLLQSFTFSSCSLCNTIDDANTSPTVAYTHLHLLAFVTAFWVSVDGVSAIVDTISCWRHYRLHCGSMLWTIWSAIII